MGVPLALSQVPGVTPYVQYVSANGQTVFPYPFPVTQDSDLVAVVNGITLNTDSGYSLSGQGNATGGNVTFALGQTAGTIITLYRDVQIDRISQIAQNSGFSSTVFNAEFNNIYLIMQQLEASIAQCLQIPNTNNPAPTTSLAPANYANKYLAFDANGNPSPAALIATTITQAIIANLLNPQTPAERSAGVVPVNYASVAGGFLRYGMDPTGVSDSTAALLNAAKCNAEIFDDYPGGGTYLFNSEAIISTYPLTIRGQAKNIQASSTTGVTGTIFKLMSAAGSGKACLRWNGFNSGVTIRNISFQFQSSTLGQIALRFSSDTRGFLIGDCFFGGARISGNNTIGIQFDSASPFSGLGVIRGNYFNSLFKGIWLQGSCTTMRINENDFTGYSGIGCISTFAAPVGGSGYTNGVYQNVPLTGGSGTGALAQITVAGGAVTSVVVITGGNGYVVSDNLGASNANLGGTGSGFSALVTAVGNNQGYGVQIDYPGSESCIGFNHFEGWSTGILCNGAGYIQQIANTYEVNTVNFNWYKTSFSRVWNQSIGESFVSGGAPVYNINDTDANMIVSGPGIVTFDRTTVQSDSGYSEQRRTGAGGRNGQYVNPAFSAGNFTASGSMTCTVTGGEVANYCAVVNGNQMAMHFKINSFALGGTPSTEVRIAIPQMFGAQPSVSFQGNNTCRVQNNGVWGTGFVQADPGNSYIRIFADASGATNWTASGNTSVEGTIAFQINGST